MADLVEVKVPDIGDFADVPVIEVLVVGGRRGGARGPAGRRWSPTRRRWTSRRRGPGTVAEVKVAVGDTVSEGSLILLLAPAAADGATPERPRRPRRADEAPAEAAGRRGAGARRGRPRAGRGARRRAGRLHGRVPRRRPRSGGGADRPRRDARRRLPERRLHPVQGAAARRARCSPRPRSWRVRRLLRRARRSTSTRCAAGRTAWSGRLDRRARRAGQAAQGRRWCAATAQFTGPNVDHRADGRRRDDRRLRALHHRGGLERRLAARSCPTTSAIMDSTGALEIATSPSGCSSSAAGSSAWRWPPSTTRSAPR